MLQKLHRGDGYQVEEETTIDVTVYGFQEKRYVYIGDYKGSTIEIDPFITGLMDEPAEEFEGRLQLTGEWDDNCFMADGFARLLN